MSQALDDGGVGGAGGACQPMEERGRAWVGKFRAGAKGQSAERADAAVVRQAGAPDFFKPGIGSTIWAACLRGGAHSPWRSCYARRDAFGERVHKRRGFLARMPRARLCANSSDLAGFELSQVGTRGLSFAGRGEVKHGDSLKSWLPRVGFEREIVLRTNPRHGHPEIREARSTILSVAILTSTGRCLCCRHFLHGFLTKGISMHQGGYSI